MSEQFGGHTSHAAAGAASADAGRPSYGEQWARPAPAESGPVALAPFVSAFPPGEDVQRASEEFLTYARGRVPEALLQLWREHGVGFYGDQRVALLDPGEWMGVLQTWLGPDVSSFPIAATSFGHLYHYDRVGDSDRIQCLDPHFQTNTVVSADLVSFFNEHLTSGSSHVADLEGPRGGARDKLGPLSGREIYFFVPMLALGGTVSPDSLAKGNGVDHLREIHRMVAQARG